MRDAPFDALQNKNALEDLLLSMGLNDEIGEEFPRELGTYSGFGLYSWQYPSQFSGMLLEICKLNINSYIEIGVRHGGTFIIITEYHARFNSDFEKSIAVDHNGSSSLRKYANDRQGVEFITASSLSDEFRDYINKSDVFDLAFIDGDHSYEDARSDFVLMRDKARHLIFHDIASIARPGNISPTNRIVEKNRYRCLLHIRPQLLITRQARYQNDKIDCIYCNEWRPEYP